MGLGVYTIKNWYLHCRIDYISQHASSALTLFGPKYSHGVRKQRLPLAILLFPPEQCSFSIRTIDIVSRHQILQVSDSWPISLKHAQMQNLILHY